VYSRDTGRGNSRGGWGGASVPRVLEEDLRGPALPLRHVLRGACRAGLSVVQGCCGKRGRGNSVRSVWVRLCVKNRRKIYRKPKEKLSGV